MTMITPSYLGETIEYSSLHACRSTLEDPTDDQGTVCLNKSLGMRWNDSPGPKGFPVSGPAQTPVWLVIPQDLSIPFLTSLLGKPYSNPKAILNALQEIEARGDLTPKPATPATVASPED